MPQNTKPLAEGGNALAFKAMIAGALILAVGLFVLGRTATIAYYNHRFSGEGVATNGTVTKLTSREGSRGTYYYVTYSYTDSLAFNHLTRSSISPSEWKKLSVGASIAVIFLSNEPETNRLNSYADQYYYQEEGGRMAFVFGGFMALVGSGLMAACWYQGKSQPGNPRPAQLPLGKYKPFHRTY